jgi:hypothetical protein
MLPPVITGRRPEALQRAHGAGKAMMTAPGARKVAMQVLQRAEAAWQVAA